MGKKIVSLLLVVVMLVSCFSMAVSARQVGVGGGAESFNPVTFSQDGEDVGDTTVSTGLLVKITDSNYKVKINSVAALMPYYSEGQTAELSVSYTAGTVVTDEIRFDVTGTIDAETNTVVRYTVGYDILDKNGNTVWKNLTGYGYGKVAGSAEATGAIGTYYGTPGQQRDGAVFTSIDTLNSCYVQVPELSLNYALRTQAFLITLSTVTTTVGVTSGNAPGTLSTSSITWPTSQWFQQTESGTWLTMSEPDSGYYNFTVNFNAGGASWEDTSNTVVSTEMYHLKAADKNAALDIAEYPLGLNGTFNNGYYVQKGKYTEASWNNFISALDLAYQVAYAVPGANYGYKLACINGAAADDALSTAFTNLEEAECDWTTYKDAEISSQPTCDGEGAKTYYCLCGKTRTESLSSAGCKPDSEWTETIAPTCTTKGEEVQLCTVCNTPVNSREIEALGHTPSEEWTEKTAPTCLTDGEEVKVCTVCGVEVENKTIDALQHSYSDEVTEPTCLNKGYTTYTCVRGDHTYISDYIDAKGHTAGEVKINDATAVNDGLKTTYCADCGEIVSTETLAKAEGKVVFTAQSNSNTILTGVVSENYSAKITIPKGSVINTGEVTGSLAMTDIASLGIEGTRTYEKTITTGVEREVLLDNYLPAFESATVSGMVDGKPYAYDVIGTDTEESYTIEAVPQNEEEVRAAYQAAASHTTASTKETEDSYAEIPGTAYVQIGTEKLSFEDTDSTLKLDNIVQGSGIKAEIKSAVKLEEVEELENAQIEMYLPQGTVLAMGQSVLTLNDDATITMYGYRDSDDINTILSMLRDCQSNEDIIKTAVLFVSDFANAVDGNELEVNIEFDHITEGDWVEIKAPTASEAGKEVKYCIMCGEIAEERELAPLGVEVSGTVESFLEGSNADGTAETTLELIKDGETLYSTSVAGTGVQVYSFDYVADGTYTLKVSKLNHVTREYEITVSGEDVAIDLKIHLLGDVDGNGSINVIDYATVLRHVKKTALLEGYELACGDIDGSGGLTVVDYAGILRHVKKTALLW